MAKRLDIALSGPWITQKEIDYVTDAVTNAWYDQAGMYHERFEKAFAAYIGVQYAMALPSCTSAIHLSLAALNVGPGDEVIVPDVTWIASAAPIAYLGAVPVFADIDATTWCLSAQAVEEAVTPRTKAIVAVDLYGGMPDMAALRQVADRHGLPLIEDAAEACGAEYCGKKAGSFGDTGVFSFHGSKTLTTGEGGMLVTNHEELYRRALFLGNHGRQVGDRSYYNAEIAYKYKMSSMQAALGLAQLERIDELVLRKREIFRWYQEELSPIQGITLNQEPTGTLNTYWMVTIVAAPELAIKKEAIIEQMARFGVDCRPFFHPLSSLPPFQQYPDAQRARQRNVVSYRLSPRAVNLPSGLILTREQVRTVCGLLRDILQKHPAKEV